MSASIFNDLFVLELANNHWGKLDRGLKIVSDFARVVRFNDVHAAIKLQFRDVDSFVHRDYRDRAAHTAADLCVGDAGTRKHRRHCNASA